jgi:hypothetical protein
MLKLNFITQLNINLNKIYRVRLSYRFKMRIQNFFKTNKSKKINNQLIHKVKL